MSLRTIALGLAVLASGLGLISAHAAGPLKYRETLHLTWGEVRVIQSGRTETEECWFTRNPPTFTNGPSFSDAQRRCLVESFMVCTGRVGQTTIWRITDALLANADPESFKARATANQCGVSFGNFRLAPEDWSSGSKSLDWTFGFDYQLLVVPPPDLEITLLIDDVPAGSAWEVPLERLLADDRLREYAALPPNSPIPSGADMPWVHVFLAAPPLRPPPQFPTVVPATNLSGFEVPLGFALRAVVEAAEVLGADRTPSTVKLAELDRRLSPNSPTSGVHRWFPEPDRTQKALPNTFVKTDTDLRQLVRISLPPTGPDTLERVRADANEWAIRAGPFRRVLPPVAHVGSIRGRTNNYPVERLPELIKDPDALRQWQGGIRTVEERMQRAVDEEPEGIGEFFWLPTLKEPHAQTVRTLERTKNVSNVQSAFLTNRFQYEGTYTLHEASGKLGLAYNSNDGFGGEAAVTVLDWPRPGDALHVQGRVAERAFDGTLSYRIPYYRSLDRSSRFQIEAFGQAGRDDHYRLGSVSPDPFEHRHADGGLEHRFTHLGDGWDATIIDSVLWDAHELKQSTPSYLERDAGLLLRDRQIWRLTPEAAPEASVRWEHVLAPSIAYGPDVGWRSPFVFGELQAGSKASFGGENLDEMYVSLQGAFGSGSQNLPTPLLFRMGNADRLFGLEPGEFSGRSYVHGELAFGISLAPLLGGVFKDAQGKGAPPSALQGLGLQMLAEIGSVSADHAFNAVTSPDKVLSSYGVALEKSDPVLGGTGFRLGYAWSPESVREEGRVFASLNWSF